MSGTEGTSSDQDNPTPVVPETREEEAVRATAAVLHPAIPTAGAAILMETDPRLHQPSETERELRELVESNDAAEKEADAARSRRPDAGE